VYLTYTARLPKSCTADRQGRAIEGNAADDTLMVDQGKGKSLDDTIL